MWVLVVLTACKSQATPWAETTTPFSMDCATCEVLLDGELPHLGEALVVANPEVDDPQAQWIACMTTLLDCLATGEADGCMDDADCPADCKRAYRKAAKGADDEEARLDAIESVMFADGLCELPSIEEVSP